MLGLGRVKLSVWAWLGRVNTRVGLGMVNARVGLGRGNFRDGEGLAGLKLKLGWGGDGREKTRLGEAHAT